MVGGQQLAESWPKASARSIMGAGWVNAAATEAAKYTKVDSDDDRALLDTHDNVAHTHYRTRGEEVYQ